jgi:ABC-2 type transport system permease protein
MITRVGLLARLETVLFFREPVAVFFSFVFSLLLLAFVGSIYGSQSFDDVRFIDTYFPIMVGATAANIAVLGLAIHLAEERGRGVLRRYRLSPVGDLEFLAAQMICAAVVLALSTSGMALFTVVFYGVSATVDWPLFVAGCLLTMYVMFSIGVFIGSLKLPLRSIQVLGAAVYFFMFFSSGAGIPRSEFPASLRFISDLDPLTHLNNLLVASYTTIDDVSWIALAVILASTVALNLVTRKTFDWEGRQ